MVKYEVKSSRGFTVRGLVPPQASPMEVLEQPGGVS